MCLLSEINNTNNTYEHICVCLVPKCIHSIKIHIKHYVVLRS